MSAATPATGRIQGGVANVNTTNLDQLLADAEAWNRWAASVNAKALAAGLVTAAELARDRERGHAARARLYTRPS